MQNAGAWTALARRRGIGLKREGRPTRHSRSTRSSRSDDLSSADDLGHTPQWSTLPRRRHSTHPQQCTVLKVITGHHPPSRTSSHQFIWHVTPRTPPASPTCPPPRRAVPAQRIQDTQRKGNRLSALLRLIKSPNAPRRKQLRKRRKKVLSSIYRTTTVILNAHFPVPTIWYVVRYVCPGFMLNVPVRTRSTRAFAQICSGHNWKNRPFGLFSRVHTEHKSGT